VKVEFFITESEYLDIFREILVVRQNNKMKPDERIALQKDNLELILSDGSLYNHKGNIDFIDRGVDATTGSILVQASFPNPDFILRPGLFAKIKIEMQVIRGAILIPQRCITELQGRYSVYAVNDSNKVETIQITPGQKIDDYIVVTEGLKPNDKIVIDALQKVQTGMVVSPTVIEFQSQKPQQ
jgi:membrane fusion protein (multidrug efflux system)